MDKSIHRLLNHYLDSEVEKVSSVMIHRAVSKINHDRSFYFISSGSDSLEKHIIYNTKEINLFQTELMEQIQEEIYQIEMGNMNSYHLAIQDKLRKKYPFFRNGYLCEVGFNSLRGSVVFGNIGPVIPIKLTFLSYSTSNVLVDVKEYGVNNAMIEVSIEIKISNLITMPISTRRHNTVVKEILSLEMIQGEVPQYYAMPVH